MCQNNIILSKRYNIVIIIGAAEAFLQYAYVDALAKNLPVVRIF